MRRETHADNGRNRPGIVLLITLVILVILSTLAYTLSARVAARRHRNNYLVDYTQAQYACNSAMKYALVSLNTLDAKLISRPNDPDFSDVFAMSDSDYEAMLARFVKERKIGSKGTATSAGKRITAGSEDANGADDALAASDSNETSLVVPGPYGPAWPLVIIPSEIEIASAKVTIEVEDENAKYPLGWAMINEEELKGQANVSYATFFEWMKYNEQEISDLKKSLVDLNVIRPFKMTLTPISVAMPVPVSIRNRPTANPAAASTPAANARSPAAAGGATATRGIPPTSTPSAAASPARGTAPTPAPGTTLATRPPPRRTVSPAEQEIQQGADMARLFQGGMIDTDLLSRPTVASSERTETAMKYLGLWGTRQVNVNTAPRHVLEAALAFGSVRDAPKMASAIIVQRKIKPFGNIDEVKKILSQYADSIDRCKNFITTTSTVFTVRVTAVSGVAKVVAVAGIAREGRQVKRIAVMSE
jgi:hypothetical protein